MPCRRVGAVHELRFDAVAGQQGRDDPVAGPEERARGDDPVARLEMAEQRGVHRGHAARGGAAGLRALERGEPRLQHRDRRVAEAAILVVLDGAGEGRGGLLGAVVHEARGEEERLCRFRELAARDSAMDKQRGGREGGAWHLNGPFRSGPAWNAAMRWKSSLTHRGPL